MERLLHALDLAILGDWEGAKRSLHDVDDPVVARLYSLLTEQQRRQREQGRRIALARHQLGNALSVAQATVEAMLDGVLEPTPERLSGIRDALQTCGSLLVDLKKGEKRGDEDRERTQKFNLCRLLEAQTQLVRPIGESKNVHVSCATCSDGNGACIYSGDPDNVAQTVRHVLLSAVRFTPPGGHIRIGCPHPSEDLLLTVRDVPMTAQGNVAEVTAFTKLLEPVGGYARVVTDDAESASFFIPLAAASMGDE